MALTPAPPGEPALDFQAKGEVVWADLSQSVTPRRASFDGWRVTGPEVSLIRAPDGLWQGTFQRRAVAFEVRPGVLAAPGVSVSVRRQPDGSVQVSGQVWDSPVELQVAKSSINGSAGANQVALTLTAAGMYTNGAAGSLTLSGEAARLEEPVMPQLFLALLAVLVQ